MSAAITKGDIVEITQGDLRGHYVEVLIGPQAWDGELVFVCDRFLISPQDEENNCFCIPVECVRCLAEVSIEGHA